MKLIKNNASAEEWKEYYDWVIKDLPKKIDNIVTSLAEELKLSLSTGAV